MKLLLTKSGFTNTKPRNIPVTTVSVRNIDLINANSDFRTVQQRWYILYVYNQ